MNDWLKMPTPEIDQLAGELTAILDETHDGSAWEGEASVLADKVRKIIESEEESLPEIDATCDCKRCTDRTKETYLLKGGCSNCGAQFMVKMRKGDRSPLSVDCPSCEVSVYTWKRL